MAANKIDKKYDLPAFKKTQNSLFYHFFVSFGVREYDSGVISMIWGQINPQRQNYILYVFISVTASATYPHNTITQNGMKCFHISKCFICQGQLL